MAGTSDRAAVAAVYAEAMLGLAERRGEADGLRAELGALARLARTTPAFAAFLANPLIDEDRRAASLERMLAGRASDLLVDALQVINRKGRIGLLPEIAAAYDTRHDALRGVIEVRVASAVPLDGGQRERLRAAVRAKTGREARLTESVEPNLLGGLVVRLGDRKVDGTIETSLRTLMAALLARATQEILSGTHVEYGT